MTNRRNTRRVFIALDLPPSTKDSLRLTVQELQSDLQTGIRWVDPGGIHLTLKFLGEVEEGVVERVINSMGEASGRFPAPSIGLSLAGLGVFPNTWEPRVLWAGVTGEMEALLRLQMLVDEAMVGVGFPPERRPFRPHLTLGRVRDQVSQEDRRRIGSIVRSATLATVEKWEAREVHLIRSNLTPQGAIYDSIGQKALGS